MLARHGATDRDQGRRAEEADRHAGQGETRVGPGDRQIAGGDELTAGGGGDALDRGDHRLFQFDDPAHQLSAARHRALEERRAAVGVVAMRLQFLEVVAGRQRRTFAGEHDDARRRISGDRREGVDQGLDHRQAQRVARRRRLQRQRRHAGGVVAAQKGGRILAGRGGHSGCAAVRICREPEAQRSAVAKAARSRAASDRPRRASDRAGNGRAGAVRP